MSIYKWFNIEDKKKFGLFLILIVISSVAFRMYWINEKYVKFPLTRKISVVAMLLSFGFAITLYYEEIRSFIEKYF